MDVNKRQIYSKVIHLWVLNMKRKIYVYESMTRKELVGAGERKCNEREIERNEIGG